MVLDTPGDFLSEATIGTFAGATGAVAAVTVLFRRVFGVNHPSVPALASLIISFGLAQAAGKLHDFMSFLIAFLNGCLLFCAAIGANEAATSVAHPQPAGQGEPQGAKKKEWFQSIFS